MRRLLALLILISGTLSAFADPYIETPVFEKQVAAGELPPVEKRLPELPRVINLAGMGRRPEFTAARGRC